MMRWLVNLFRREPDRYIGGTIHPYMLRWYVIPRNRWFNIYLHKIMRDDDDRALHDHPWPSLSIILAGRYREVTPRGSRVHCAGRVMLRSSIYRHRLEVGRGVCWTLFITGPMLRTWGFWCPQGFVPWKEFANPDNPDEIGRGCGEGNAA